MSRVYDETSFDYEIVKITSDLYIGDEKAAKAKKLLQDLKIKRIIVVGEELSPAYPGDFEYFHLPLRDYKKENIMEHFQKTNDFISKALQKKEPVLVHCAKGKSRSATIIIAYLMQKFKISSQEALCFVKRKRKEVSPNEGFMFQLQKYEALLGITDKTEKIY